MSETVKPDFPPAMTCQQLRDYLDAHCQAGRGNYYPEVRSHYLTAPPGQETHDDSDGVVIINGYY